MEWQPIETAPKDGSLFVAKGFNYGDESRGIHYCIAANKGHGFYEVSQWNERSALDYLTHWVPLPEAPDANPRR